MTRRRQKILQMIDRLESQEQQFLRQQFLAPVVRGCGVRVRIDGIVCSMRVDPTDFNGWGVFRPISFADAMLDRRAMLGERRRYLELFAPVRLIVCRQARDRAWAVAANPGDARCRSEGLLPIELCENVERFDTIVARFDGSQFWFDQLDPSADAGAAAYLRRMLAQMTDTTALDRSGLSAAQRHAYAINYDARRSAIERDARQRDQRRLRETLAHAGAQLRDLSESHGQYRVSFDFDGQRHTCLVGRDLTVRSAGICLSGLDSEFDMNSLVGVLREARSIGRA